MKEVRLNSEKKINSKNFQLKIGTTNKKEPIVIYIEGKTFISPQILKDDYTKDISEIKHDFKISISNNLCQNKMFDKKFILDFQVAAKGILFNKKSFLSFQFLLKQNPQNILELKDLKQKAEPLIFNIINDLEKTILDHDFFISKTKRTINS